MVKSIIWTKKRVIACLLTAVLAVGCLPFFEKGSLAEENTDAELQPTPNYYTTTGQKTDAANADIALSKTAERIGPDEWEVTVEATIGDEPVQKRKLEFVFVLDISSSMLVCADHDTSHAHDEDCGDLICTLNAHVHDEPGSNSKCYTQCTKNTYSQHWSGNSHKSEYDCVKIESNNWWKYYRLICSEHQHTTACFSNEKLICKNIVHGNEGSYMGGCTCYYDGHLDNGTEGRTVYNRLNVAKEAAENLIASLPAGTTVHRVTFHGDGATQSVESFYGISNGSGTYMMQGINFGINQFSSNSASKKILVVLTDGESKDGNSSTELTNFKNNGGTVFTIGFSYDNDALEQIASDDGAYLQATGAVELNMVMDQISSSITAMLEDPMSPSVNFIPGSIDEIKVAEGKFETVGQTIYWYPGTEGDSVQNKTIKYSYTVKLNKNDDSMSAGSYQNIDLNAPTYLLFAVTKTENSVSSTETIRARFPIPAADYSVATLDVKGKCGNEIIYAREKERIIADELSDFDYTPAFATSYAPLQYYTNGSNYYRYKNTSTYTANGERIDEDQIDPADDAAYVVVHEYEQIGENEYKNLYPVTYQYTYKPKYAPDCPDEELILKDTENVEVADEPYCEGYAFSGWTTNDVTVSEDGTFTMPGNQVVFTGTWTKLDSYQVKVNYYTKTDGVAADKPDGTRTSQVQYGSASQTYDFEDLVEWDNNNYTADRSLAEGSEGLASFVDGENKLTDIVPTSPTKTITINLYREVTNEYNLNIKHVFQDGSTHEGYNTEYAPDGSSYQYNSSWQVTPKEAPTGYAWVESKSGEAVNDTDTTLKNTDLSGDAFGTADKYVIITYEKLPSYKVLVNYYTKTDGGEYQLDNTSPVIAKDVTYGKESGEAEFSSIYKGNSYSNPQLAQSQDGVTIEGNKVKGIQPTDSTKVITINLYREVTNEYNLNIKHVFQDGSTHEGYNTEYAPDGSSYQYNSSWQVTPKEAPSGYAFVADESGVATSSTVNTLTSTDLSGDAFGAADKYVIITYEKLPSYQVSHQYYEEDLNGNRTLVSADSYTTDPVTMNHGDTVAASGLTADLNGKTDAVTYTEVSRTPESITLSKKGIQTITITYVRYQAPITVHYVDTEGTPLKEDYTETLFAGDAYDLNTPVVQIIEILKDGVPYDFAYDDTDDDTGYAGVLPREGVEITLVYQKRGKATATVQYVDEDGNALQLPLMTEEMYIGEPYDVSEALQVQQITLGGSEYAFDHHFQTRAPLRSVGSLTFVEDVDYKGAMPPGGIQITRVYRLGKVTYYYQQKNVYTAYDADGNVVYSGTQEFPILTSEVAIATLNALESFEYEGYGFWRVSEETMTADLTGTAPDKPYVFIVYYEFRQGDEPVPDTQLPPGITAPESTPQPTATAPVDTLPPQTGDEGVALWQWLMVLASAGLVLMLKAQRKTRREER